MIIFYISYIRWIQRYLTTDTSINNIQTMIYWGQLFVWVAVWIGAIWIAVAQIRISQEQWKIIDKQTKLIKTQLELSTYNHNVNKAQYHVEILARNLDTNLLQTIAASIVKYLDKDENVRSKVEKWLQNVDVWIWKINTKLDEAIDKYHEAINNLPKSLKFE